MTGIIRILDEKSISQIAAGEVVEAPFSALKELAENSLDAGADSISFALEAGGTRLIRVADNGMGMSGEDLRLAFQRHSTSKIASAKDLANIVTLGFRGEALASVASVARVEAVSRLNGADDGYRIVIEGSAEKAFAPAGCPEGTVVTVRDLFYNTPARRKFLKSPEWEGKRCLAVFRALALSRPEVEWKYYQDNRLRFQTPPASLKERIADLLGNSYLEGLVEVEFAEGDYKISGFICDTSRARGTREHQYLFLNRRRILDQMLAARINQVFQKEEGTRNFPYYVLFLETDSSQVDINVHPAKTEVRFRRAKQVGDFARRAVVRALGVEAVMSMDYHTERTASRPPFPRETGQRITLKEYSTLFEKPTPSAANVPAETRGKPAPALDDKSAGHYIPKEMFQLHGKYIVTPVKDGMTLIDQHAAHERILFEAALRNLSHKNGSPQKLLFPSMMELPPPEAGAFEELLPFLETMGFIVKPFGPRSYLIEAVPSGVKISDEVRLMRDILDYYRENAEKLTDRAEAAAAAFACHAAIKTEDSLTPEEMVSLIENLFRTGTPFACPHGRPTYIKITMDELDRRFGRKK